MGEIRPGVTVKIDGLKGAPELNGKEGKVKDWNAEKGRWNVQVAGELKGLKPENLQPAATQGKSDASGASGGMAQYVLMAAAVLMLSATFMQQNGGIGAMKSPTKYVTELFEPFDPPPPKAPKDTVVISFCQG